MTKQTSLFFFLAVMCLFFIGRSSRDHFTGVRFPSATYDLGAGVILNDNQIASITQALEKTNEEKIYYHWTNDINAIRWGLQGHIESGELDFLNLPTGDRQAYGPGFYVARSTTSSKDFGNSLIEIKVPANTFIYNNTAVNNIVGSNLSHKQISKLGEIVPFVRNVTADWFVINHHSMVRNVHFAPKELNPIQNKSPLHSTLEFYPRLWNAIRQSNEGHYFESLITLPHYQDGISFIRSLNVSPDNPWDEFESEHFEKYRKTLQRVIYQSSIKNYGEQAIPPDASIVSDLRHAYERGELNADLGIVQNGSYKSGLNKQDWVNYQIETNIKELYQSVSGDYRELDDIIRDEGVRAGGTNQGQQFVASFSDTANLIKNPYIDAKYVPNPNGEGFLVHYFYPDTFHYKHLKGHLSDELYDLLETQDKAALMSTEHELRKSLNKRIIKELLVDLFSRYHGSKSNFDDGKSINLMMDFISIHPFQNFNGRVSRLYFTATNLQNNRDAPIHLLGDFDLLKSPAFYRKILSQSEEHYSRFRLAALQEILDAKREGKTPRVHEIPEFKDLIKGFEAFGLKETTSFNDDQFDLIKERKFAELFDQVIGPKWRYADFEGVINVFSAFEDKNIKATYLQKLMNDDFFENIPRDTLHGFLDGIDNFDELIEFIHFFEQYGKNEIKNIAREYLLNKLSSEKIYDSISNNTKISNFIKNIISQLDETPLKLNQDAGKDFFLFIYNNTLQLDKDKRTKAYRDLYHSQWETRQFIAKSLASVPLKDDIFEILELLLRDNNGDVQTQINKTMATIFQNTSDARITNFLTHTLSKSGELTKLEVWVIYHYFLAHAPTVTDSHFIDYIKMIMPRISWSSRVQVVTKLGTLKNHAQAFDLIFTTLSNDRNNDVRRACHNIILNSFSFHDKNFLDAKVNSILSRTNKPDSTESEFIFHYISKRDDFRTHPKYFETLKRISSSLGRERRWTLVYGLRNFLNQDQALFSLYDYAEDSDGEVKTAANNIIAAFVIDGEPQYIEGKITQFLNSPESLRRGEAELAFTYLLHNNKFQNHPNYFSLVHSVLNNKNRGHRRQMINHLKELTPSSDLVHFIQRYTSDSDEDIRTAAKKALELLATRSQSCQDLIRSLAQ